MRSIFIDNCDFSDKTMEIRGTNAHHFINVLRLKKDDLILVLDGRGKSAEAKIQEINKKTLIISLGQTKEHINNNKIDLAIGILKKDALDEVIRSATEIGVNSIILLKTTWSQKYEINEQRIKKIMISALEQSNNPFMPKLQITDLESIEYGDYESIFMCSINKESKPQKLKNRNLLLIGPEGGFTADEEANILSYNPAVLSFDTPILRAKTACIFALGSLY